MAIDIDDPRLTAYALGELEGAERADVEKVVASSAEARAVVEEIRATAEVLSAGLGGEKGPELQVLQRERVRKEAMNGSQSRRSMGFAKAAIVFLAVGIPAGVIVSTSMNGARVDTNQLAANRGRQNTSVGNPSLPGLQSNVSPPSPTQIGVDGAKLSQSSVPPNDVAYSNTVAHTYNNTFAGGADSNSTDTVSSDWIRHSVHAREGSSTGPAISASLNIPPENGLPADVGTGRSGSYVYLRQFESQPIIEAINKYKGVAASKGDSPSALSPPPVVRLKCLQSLEERNPLGQPAGAESYEQIRDNPFYLVREQPLSTFSIDVDTASYSNIRRFLTGGQMPPKDAVRIEEMINYFAYNDAPPTGDDPFSVNVEMALCPWRANHRLARVALKGKTFPAQQRPACNLVFLVDVSGSMQPENKLPLVQRALGLLVEQLDERDRVAIVVYAGSSGLVLPSTTCNNRDTIRHAIDNLSAGGSTNGGEGIQLAYKVAAEHFNAEGVNRVILATDGDFNVGVTSQNALVELIQEKAKSKVFLSVFGFGMGNLKDSTLEKLADKGNGQYGYIDTLNEARKVFVEQVAGTLVTIAKDVKIQIEFNPAVVAAYRLIGYENRILAAQDFNDDRKDAGEIGAGHSVTALYEIVPVGQPIDVPSVDPLKYQRVEGAVSAAPAEPKPNLTPAATNGETMTVKLRYKQPQGDVSQLIERPVMDSVRQVSSASNDFRWSAAVAAFGMILRDSPHRGDTTCATVLDMAQGAVANDASGYRAEFVELVKKAQAMSPKSPGWCGTR